MTKYRWVLAGLTALGLVAALRMAGARWQVEQDNRMVELVADYGEIVDLATDTGNPVETVLERLQKAGLTSVAVSEETLTQLVNSGKLEVAGEVNAPPEYLSRQDDRNLFLSTSDRIRFERILAQLQHKYPPGRVTLLTPLPSEPPTRAAKPLVTGPAARPESSPEPTLPGPPWILRVPEDQDRLNEVGLGLSEEQIHRARRAGLRVVARLRNYPGLTPEAARYMLKHVRDHQIQTVIFIGDDVLGFRDLIAPVAKAIRGKTPEETLQFGLIEFARQRGELGLALALDAAVVRVHSITEQEMRDYSAVRAVERFARAARERNIRLCFVRLFLGPQEDKLAANEEYLRLLDRHLRRALLKPSPARPFEPLKTPCRLLLLMGVGLLAALLLALNLLGLVSARPGIILLVVGAGASVAPLMVAPDGYRKLAALGAGILFPTWAGAYAFSAVRKGTEGKRRDGREKKGRKGKEGTEEPIADCRLPIADFPDSDSGKSQIANRKSQIASLWTAAGVLWRATLLTLVGAVFIVGLLTDRSFLVKIDQFAGVKLAHLLPFLLLTGLVVGRLLGPESEGRERWREAWRQYVDLARQPLLLLHVVLALAALLALAVLLIRSGNEGMEPSSLEMRFRDVLERVLFVRPRTKEFLLGHPLFFLGAAMALLGRPRWLLPCLLLGMVGQVSTLNTFCHLHTPLSISLVRTFHALWLGTLGGIALTLIVRLYRARSDVTDQAPS